MAGLVDFLLNAAAILFAVTVYSANPLALNLALVLPALAILVLSPASKTSKQLKPPSKEQTRTPASKETAQHVSLPIKPFVTTYRGCMLVITCIAILAVDFRVFPRRFGKVENWGTSLMDLGVGSFVFSAGLVGVRPTLKQRLSGQTSSLAQRLVASSRSSLPLLILGLVRLWSVKGLDYAEHVSEYGVHWNFFFTLALLPPFVALCDALFRYVPSNTALAVVVGLAYEVVLESTELTRFMLTAPRTSLLSQNREGLFSFFGYFAIFLAGQATGATVLPASRAGSASRDPVLRGLLLAAAGWSVAFFVLLDYTYGANLRVSRRLANLPYVVGVAAFNNGQMALFYAIERGVFGRHAEVGDATSRLLRAFNRNGLALFLAANLGTGLVNMALPTLHMGTAQAMGALLVYMGALSALALGLDARNITIKV